MAPRKQRYRGAHDRERRRWALQVAQGMVSCARCGRLIEPGAHWDLDHAPDGQSYLGPSHRACNRRTSTHRAARRATASVLVESPGTLSAREWSVLPERERNWRSGDLNPRRRHSREW